jgi:hypothetical protein
MIGAVHFYEMPLESAGIPQVLDGSLSDQTAGDYRSVDTELDFTGTGLLLPFKGREGASWPRN